MNVNGCFNIKLFQTDIRHKTCCFYSQQSKSIYLWFLKCTVVFVQLCTVRGLCSVSVGGTPQTAVRLSPCPLQTSGDTKLRAMVTSAQWHEASTQTTPRQSAHEWVSPQLPAQIRVNKQQPEDSQPRQLHSVIKKLEKQDQLFEKRGQRNTAECKVHGAAACVIGLLAVGSKWKYDKHWKQVLIRVILAPGQL